MNIIDRAESEIVTRLSSLGEQSFDGQRVTLGVVMYLAGIHKAFHPGEWLIYKASGGPRIVSEVKSLWITRKP